MKLSILALSVFVLAGPWISCSGERDETLTEILHLSRSLADEYKEPLPNVNLNSLDGHRKLTITFTNPSFNTLPGRLSGDKAMQIANFIKSHYAGIDTCDIIDIVFVKQKRFLVFCTNSDETFTFKTQDLVGK